MMRNQMSSSGCNKSMLPNKVGFVTDIEGNYDYWQRYLAISNVLYKSNEEGSNNKNSIKLRDCCEFVYGGDICDRGPGDLRVINDMLHLKRHYPDRVHFILGNRDINKLRLYVELHETSLQQPGKTYWIDKTSPANETASQRLKWILSETMGAPLAFEYRREELKTLNQPYDDVDVAQSFIDSVAPVSTMSVSNKHVSDGSISNGDSSGASNISRGCLTEYLSYGKVAHIINDVLFVHGALRDYNIGWLPPKTRRSNSVGRRVLNPHEWCAEINALAHQEIKDYQNKVQEFIDSRTAVSAAVASNSNNDNITLLSWATDGGYNHIQPGSRLMQYGMGWLKDKTVNPSVIYSSYLGAATLTTPVVTPSGSPNQSSRTINREDLMRCLEDDDDDEEEEEGRGSNVVKGTNDDHMPQPVSESQSHAQAVLTAAMNALSLAFTSEKNKDINSNNDNKPPSPPPPSSLTAPPLPSTVVNTSVSGKGYSNNSSRRSSGKIDGGGYIDGIDINVVAFLTLPVPPRLSSPRSNHNSPRSSSSSSSSQNNSSKHVDIHSSSGSSSGSSSIISGHTNNNNNNNNTNNNNNNNDTINASDNDTSSSSSSSFPSFSTSPIHKVVVGHIPRGDAPLILDSAHGLQVMHGDTSYANNTVWDNNSGNQSYIPEPLSKLYTSSNLNHSINNVELLLQQCRQCHVQLDTLSSPPMDSTRGVAISEIIFINSCSNNDSTTTTNSPPPPSSSSSSILTPTSSTATPTSATAATTTTTATVTATTMTPLIHGRLSNGLDYAFELKSSGTSYIGRKTHDGWVVKATGVRATSVSNSGTNNKDINMYYLLTLAEGFTVRNKLVLEADIKKVLGIKH